MRTKEILGILFLFLFTFSFVSCNNDDEEEAEVGQIVVMSVSSKLVWIESKSSPYEQDQRMECIIEGADEKLYLDKNEIEGFKYISGYEHRLKVRITSLDNPSTDVSKQKYELIEILSQNKVVGHSEIQLKYAIDADQKSAIEDDLLKISSEFVGSYYVIDGSTWSLIDENDVPIIKGGQLQNLPFETELPESYKLLPPDEQIATYRKMIFTYMIGSEQMIRPYDAIITLMPGGRDSYYRLWLYEDLTDNYKRKFPDAGVRGVVRAQRLSYNGW